MCSSWCLRDEIDASKLLHHHDSNAEHGPVEDALLAIGKDHPQRTAAGYQHTSTQVIRHGLTCDHQAALEQDALP